MLYQDPIRNLYTIIDRICIYLSWRLSQSIFIHFISRKNGTLHCDVTMTLIRQEKKFENIFFLKQHILFLKKMNLNHFYPKMHTKAQISTKRPALPSISKFIKDVLFFSSQDSMIKDMSGFKCFKKMYILDTKLKAVSTAT